MGYKEIIAEQEEMIKQMLDGTYKKENFKRSYNLRERIQAFLEYEKRFLGIEDLKGIPRYTIKQLSEYCLAGEDFFIMKGNFLDEFKIVDSLTKAAMLKEAPEDFEPNHSLAFTGGMAHKLANDAGIEVPNWVFEPRFYLDKPFYCTKMKGKMAFDYMLNIPPELKCRNLFIHHNTFFRV